jgi:hypothetical protein
MKRVVRFAIFAVLGFMIAGCYSYKPLGAPSPGADVRAQLTAEAAARRSQGMEEPILHYDGTVVETSPDSLTIDVLVARSASAFQNVEIRDTVRLARGEIQSILSRKLSPTKSIVVTVLAGVAAVAIVKGIDSVVGGTGDNTNPPPPGARVPVVRWITNLLQPVLVRTRR